MESCAIEDGFSGVTKRREVLHLRRNESFSRGISLHEVSLTVVS